MSVACEMGGLRAAHLFVVNGRASLRNSALVCRNAGAPAAVEAIRAAVLVPVFRGIQRQFPQDRAGLCHSVPLRRARRRSPDYLASAVFIAPYFFLSALGGEIADRYDKARVAQWLKFVEIFVAALAVVGLRAARHSRCCLSRCSALASLRRCSGRSNTASCRIISDAKTARRQCAGGRRDLRRHLARNDRRRTGRARRGSAPQRLPRWSWVSRSPAGSRHF